LLSVLLNSPECLAFLRTVSFRDSMRPITKRVLQRIDLVALYKRVDQKALSLCVRAELEHLGVEPGASEVNTSWELLNGLIAL